MDTDTDGAFCLYSVFISPLFLSVPQKLTDTDETKQEIVGAVSGSLAYSSSNTSKTQQISKILEKWQNFLRRGCKSGYEITDISMMLPCPHTGTAGRRSDRNWTSAGQQRRRSGGLRKTGLFELTERRPLLDILPNIHPNVRYPWK